MSNQRSFSELEYMGKKRLTRREKFLNDMDAIIPWASLLSVIEPYYPKSGQPGRQPIGLSKMFRIHCMQNWFNYSDRQMEDALYEIESIRRFSGFNSVLEDLPDETSVLNFRHLLEKHDLTKRVLATINEHLKEQGLMVSQGTMVDATIIQAATSTKNKDKKRDPDMHSARKGNQWHFGMKIHVGADVDSGAVHTVTTTSANIADIDELPKLLRYDDAVVFADAGYTSDSYKRGAKKVGLRWCVNDKRKPKKNLSASQRKRNRKQSSIRARVEHVFRVIKQQFGFQKTRYRGLKKNTSQVHMLVALSNLYMLRGKLMAV
jgi:transposase, IS5 family